MRKDYLIAGNASLPGNSLKGQRVIGLLNGLELFGHERGNIEVFKTLRTLGAEVLVGVNAVEDGGDVGIHLRTLGFTTFNLPFGNQWSWQWLKRYPLSFLEKIRQIIACSTILHRQIRQCHPSHIHLGSPLTYSYVAPALALCKIPLIYRMGDAPPMDSPFNLRIWRMAIRRTSHLVCNSDYIRRMSVVAGEGSNTVIYNLAPTHAAEPCRKNPVHGETRRLLYIGSIAEHKGLLPLVEALSILSHEIPGINLDIVGGSRWDGQFRTRLESAIDALHVADRVHFHGQVNDPTPCYQTADLHLVPSICEEALANVVLEAKCVGLPSIIFPSGGLPEMIRHQVDGFICTERTSAALAQGIRWMLADSGRLIKMGEAARTDFEARFGPERFARQWAVVYRNASPPYGGG